MTSLQSLSSSPLLWSTLRCSIFSSRSFLRVILSMNGDHESKIVCTSNSVTVRRGNTPRNTHNQHNQHHFGRTLLAIPAAICHMKMTLSCSFHNKCGWVIPTKYTEKDVVMLTETIEMQVCIDNILSFQASFLSVL